MDSVDILQTGEEQLVPYSQNCCSGRGCHRYIRHNTALLYELAFTVMRSVSG